MDPGKGSLWDFDDFPLRLYRIAGQPQQRVVAGPRIHGWRAKGSAFGPVARPEFRPYRDSRDIGSVRGTARPDRLRHGLSPSDNPAVRQRFRLQKLGVLL